MVTIQIAQHLLSTIDPNNHSVLLVHRKQSPFGIVALTVSVTVHFCTQAVFLGATSVALGRYVESLPLERTAWCFRPGFSASRNPWESELA